MGEACPPPLHSTMVTLGFVFVFLMLDMIRPLPITICIINELSTDNVQVKRKKNEPDKDAPSSLYILSATNPIR